MILTALIDYSPYLSGSTEADHIPAAAEATAAPKLTVREIETLHHVSMGLTSYEIADALHLGRETIETHRRKIMRKLNAANIVHAVAMGLRENIIK